MSRMIRILVVSLAIVAGSAGPGALSPTRTVLAVETEAGVLPAKLETTTLDKKLEEATDAWKKIGTEELFPQALNDAMDYHMSALTAVGQEFKEHRTLETQLKLLDVSERALDDLEKRFSAAALPCQKTIAVYQDISRKMQAVKAETQTMLQRLTDADTASGEALRSLEGRAREVVRRYVQGGRKDRTLKREIERLGVLIANSPVSAEIRKSQREFLATLHGNLEQVVLLADTCEDRIQEAMLVLSQVGALYGEYRQAVHLSKSVISSATQLTASAKAVTALAKLVSLTQSQGGFLDAMRAAVSSGADLGRLKDSIQTQRKGVDDASRLLGGGSTVEEMERRYGTAGPASETPSLSEPEEPAASAHQTNPTTTAN